MIHIPNLFDLEMLVILYIAYSLWEVIDDHLHKPTAMVVMVSTLSGHVVPKPEGFIHYPCIDHTARPVERFDTLLEWGNYIAFDAYDDTLVPPMIEMVYYL